MSDNSCLYLFIKISEETLNFEVLKIVGIFQFELNEFCTITWPSAEGSQGWNAEI